MGISRESHESDGFLLVPIDGFNCWAHHLIHLSELILSCSNNWWHLWELPRSSHFLGDSMSWVQHSFILTFSLHLILCVSAFSFSSIPYWFILWRGCLEVCPAFLCFRSCSWVCAVTVSLARVLLSLPFDSSTQALSCSKYYSFAYRSPGAMSKS